MLSKHQPLRKREKINAVLSPPISIYKFVFITSLDHIDLTSPHLPINTHCRNTCCAEGDNIASAPYVFIADFLRKCVGEATTTSLKIKSNTDHFTAPPEPPPAETFLTFTMKYPLFALCTPYLSVVSTIV